MATDGFLRARRFVLLLEGIWWFLGETECTRDTDSILSSIKYVLQNVLSGNAVEDQLIAKALDKETAGSSKKWKEIMAMTAREIGHQLLNGMPLCVSFLLER